MSCGADKAGHASPAKKKGGEEKGRRGLGFNPFCLFLLFNRTPAGADRAGTGNTYVHEGKKGGSEYSQKVMCRLRKWEEQEEEEEEDKGE